MSEDFREVSPDSVFSSITKISRWYIVVDVAALLFFACLLVSYFVVIRPPEQFPVAELVTIEEGRTLSQISSDLYNSHVIRSPKTFEILVRIVGDDQSVKAGEYFLSEPINMFEVAQRVATGQFELTPIIVTIFEGTTSFEMAKIFERRFIKFDTDEFLTITSTSEGYLFPDTYTFPLNADAEYISNEMTRNFNIRIKPYEDDIAHSNHSLEEILTMASLIEEEANDKDDRRIISGILWKRIEIGMPLQVDAVFPYIIGKNTYEVSLEDLRVNSPYNTYINKGLPPGPITNPGLDAIEAALYPRESPYLFYLADRRGKTYYAETYAGHKENKRRYINAR